MNTIQKIPLTQEKFALVSTKDYDFLMQWKWCATRHGKIWYAMRHQHIGMFNGRQKLQTIMMHRLILARKLGHDDFEMTDHRNGNGLHNYRSNLRPATNKQNQENRKGLAKTIHQAFVV